jgi:DNA-binding response OmpR family regulator
VKKQKVLVVDDDELQLTVLRAWLESAGFDVVTRKTSLGTSTVVRRELPDFVILDVEMPGLNGDALAKLLGALALEQKMGIVFYSGSDSLTDIVVFWDPPILGAIRKTPDSALFLSSFKRLTSRPTKR